SIITFHDSGPNTDTNTLTINGTPNDDTFLLRKGYVATLHGNVLGTRINYDESMNGGLIINGGDGNDQYFLDDNSVATTINGGGGNNLFQVGQVYQSPRGDNADLAVADQFDTTLTTRGYLSNGISKPTTINGGQGTNTFSVYSNQATLELNGGDGGDNE